MRASLAGGVGVGAVFRGRGWRHGGSGPGSISEWTGISEIIITLWPAYSVVSLTSGFSPVRLPVLFLVCFDGIFVCLVFC